MQAAHGTRGGDRVGAKHLGPRPNSRHFGFLYLFLSQNLVSFSISIRSNTSPRGTHALPSPFLVCNNAASACVSCMHSLSLLRASCAGARPRHDEERYPEPGQTPVTFRFLFLRGPREVVIDPSVPTSCTSWAGPGSAKGGFFFFIVQENKIVVIAGERRDRGAPL